jgi:hypothetical protein
MRIQPPEHLANAEFTADMVETLKTYFERYEVDGVVVVEVTSHGLWLPNPHSRTRQFLGLARLPDGMATVGYAKRPI